MVLEPGCCLVKLIFICDIRDLFSVFVFPYVICHDPLVHPFYNQYNLSPFFSV